ncbi:MAG: sugar ABC transporter substrate-binding protein [Bacteroidota bacterium]
MSRGAIIVASLVIIPTAGLFLFLSADDPADHLVFATWGTPTEVESFQRLIGHYNMTRRPAHRVKLSHSQASSYAEHLLVQAAARNLPDVVHLDRKDLPLFVHRELVEDLTPYVESNAGFDLDLFLPELLPDCKVDGRYYAIPHNFSTLVLYYNKDHFDAEGLPYPDSTWHWGMLLRAAQRLTRRDEKGETVRYGCYVHMVAHTIVEQHGGRILNRSLDTCVIATPEAERVIQYLNDLSEKHGVTWNMLAQNVLWDDMFAGGRCSMVANGRWIASYYMRSMSAGIVDVAPLPRGKYRKGAAVNHMMAISAQSTKKKEAWEFLKFLVSETGQRMVNEDGANIPALRSIAYSDEFLHHKTTPDMNNRVFLDELPHSVGWPFEQGPYLTHHTIQSQYDLAMRRILLGEATTMQSLEIMEENINRIIADQRASSRQEPFVGSFLFYICCAAPVVVAGVAWTRRKRGNAVGV